MGSCFSKLEPTGYVNLDKPAPNAIEMNTVFNRSTMPSQPEPIASRRRRLEEQSAYEAWEEWWLAVLTARSQRAAAYTRAERLAGRWDCHVAKTRCNMGVPGCTCYQGIKLRPLSREDVACASKYRCYGIIEREMERVLGPAPDRK